MDESQVVDAVAKARKGIAQYLAIMDSVHRVDVRRSRDFQKQYNAFYRVRQRPSEWYEAYFEYLERSKKTRPQFGRALDYLWSRLGRYEPSFSSKLVATLDPDLPVWDRFVLKNTGQKAPAYAALDRVQKAKAVYRSIQSWYEGYLCSDEGQSVLSVFDREVEEHHRLTDLKKVDFVLWQTRA